jgi:hypothetical protein
LIELPITITDKNGDKAVHESVVAAECSVEAIDVLANEYVVHDAHGKELKFSIQKKRTPIFFGMINSDVNVVKITEE